ncbi:MAG: glutamate--tRNA ligase [Candidatus Niyogibacteria bacterium]|nr:MAG: glutamate--tRNA ligase [Candidatus Niyogibacteria bacterium]
MIRTRIAPSPTGTLHLGTARSALFNFIFARQRRGKFILRIEDTDLERSDPVFEKDIQEGLKWLGLNWDEFYRQSDRLDLYENYLKKLLERGLIFWCPHSEEELAAERQEQALRKEVLRHFCPYRDGSADSRGGKSILRFKNDVKETIVFNDLIRGKISFDGQILGDFSVAKNMRNPLYNFAVVVDDYEMAISHVIRGEDHISNTPRQIILQDALDFKRPEYAHLPLILGQDRSKLSKRHGATSVLEYKKSGYLAEAMINFMILLGWHPASLSAAKARDKSLEKEKEVFTTDEIIEQFSLQRVQKGGAVFDIDKLNWLNHLYIKKMEIKDLAEILKHFAGELGQKIEADFEKWLKITSLMRDRLTVLNEVGESAEYFYNEPYYPRELLFWKENQPAENILRHLKHIYKTLLDIKKWQKENLENKLMPYADEAGRGEVLWPLRAALSGKRASAGPFEIAEILGKNESLRRVEKAIKIIEQI